MYHHQRRKNKADPKNGDAKGKEEPDENEEEDKLMELENEWICTEINIDRDQLTDLPWSYLWVISKYDYIDIIFSQGRLEETATAIQNSKIECELFNDTYFTRLYY